jgi:hypothetical protein
MQAVEDRINGNRPLTSKAYLERRIAEIRYDRSFYDEEFAAFEKTLWKVKEVLPRVDFTLKVTY